MSAAIMNKVVDADTVANADNADNTDNTDLLTVLLGKLSEPEPTTVVPAPLPPPCELIAEMPLTARQAQTVAESRRAIRRILPRKRNRCIASPPPCGR